MSAAFDAHLGREVTTLCHCWRLTRRDGLALGFTDHDEALGFDGTAFGPETGWGASEAKSSLGLGTDTVDVEGAISSASIAEADISAGLYDGATVEAFLVNWREPDQRELLRSATVGKIVAADGRFTAELESLAGTLDQPSGRFVTRGCDAEVGDGRCKVALAAAPFRGSGAVTAVSGAGALKVSGLGGFAGGWFARGVLTWTMSGRAVRVREHRRDAGGVELLLEPGGPGVAVGDAFTVTAGCDKSFATCGAKFGNRVNFRGFPHLPGNDAAYAYVADGVEFDGKALVP